MPSDLDAERIREEQQRRRREQRSRMEEDRHHREAEAARLQRSENALARAGGPAKVGGSEARPPKAPPRPSAAPSPGPSRAQSPAPTTPETTNVRTPGRPVRDIGGAVASPAVRQFLSIDPAERFELRVLNGLDMRPLAAEASENPEVLQRLVLRVEELLHRVKKELDDPLTAGAFLREQTLRWYRESVADDGWVARMPDAWGGIFAESRVIGGRLHPWVNTRLRAVWDECSRVSGWRARIGHGRARNKAVEAACSRTVHQQIQAEVAQALLDDLATHPHSGPTTPLVHLSELAVRRQVPTINESLSLLFSSSEIGPFIILHPNRYPDCDEVFIRPPAANATGAALAFTLIQKPAPRRSGGSVASAQASSETPTAASSESSGGEYAGDLGAIWEEATISDSGWREVITQSQRERRRLTAPPKDFRNRPSYARLRALVLSDDAARGGFLSIRWRGRPAGLPLVAQLLSEGTLSPEVSTDHEYLEAELGELAGVDARKRAALTSWQLPGWSIVREGNPGQGLKYTAQREATTAAPP